MLVPAHVPLVVATRGAAIENVHYGSIAVVEASGRLLWSAGDPRALTLTRSTLKPFQALPLLRDDGPRHFGFDARWHNCSGKHAGFLAWCSLHGAPFETYLDPGHLLQRRIRDEVGGLLGLEPDAMVAGIDGCGAPNLALPLAGLARLWALLAAGGSGPATDPLLDHLFTVMTLHPEYVSGTGRSDLRFARAGRGDWVAKVGAAGVQAIGVRSRGLGIAVKIADGHAAARSVATFAVLRGLGLAADDDADIARYAAIAETNAAGVVTGEMRPLFSLTQH